MSVADGLVVALLLALNLWYFIHYFVNEYIGRVDAGGHAAEPAWRRP